MRILLTGATGMIGRHLLDGLLAEGHHVVCAVRTLQSAPEADDGSARRVSQVQADFSQDNDKSAWLARLHDIDVVINTVGIFRQTRRQQFDQIHVAAPCLPHAPSRTMCGWSSSYPHWAPTTKPTPHIT